MSRKTGPDAGRLDRAVAEAQRERQRRARDYREQALKLFPWVCARCGREFGRHNLRELTVHHRDHDHDNNPADGSNWELLCLYCHENEHARLVEAAGGGAAAPEAGARGAPTTYRPFADLKSRLK